MNVIVTDSAGYIGGLLVRKLSSDGSVKRIVGIDLLPEPNEMASDPKIQWIQADLAAEGWEDKLPGDLPIDAVIHCAFRIRNPYGKRKETEADNVGASHAVFEFSIRRRVPKLIYLSTVSVYGAKPENIGRLLSEEEPLSERKNPYGHQKVLTERDLATLAKGGGVRTQAFVLRLNSVTGPVGQSLGSKFGLITFLKKLLPFIVEADPHWARQFVHEDDVVQIIYLLTVKDTAKIGTMFNIFNVAPISFLTAKDMSKILGKKRLVIPPKLIKPLFFLAWHVSLGHIPTRPDSATGIIYPINVNGSRVEKEIGFHYAYTAEDAFMGRKRP